MGLPKVATWVKLVKESFDKHLAPVKAWAARMELDAKHDRFMMGVAGRLKKGQAWNGDTPYGYDLVEGKYLINEVEAGWVRKIWIWFGTGDSGKTIRIRLINGNAPQRGENIKTPWPIQRIYHILKRDYYHSGVKTRKWNGSVYEISIPPILDPEIVYKVQQRFQRWKKYPSGNIKEQALGAGLVYCRSCKTKMFIKRNKGSVYYACNNVIYTGEKEAGCASTRSIRILDAELWEKVWTLISEPDRFKQMLQKRIEELRNESVDAQAECERIGRAHENLMMERQKIITWGRQGIIKEKDMELQLLSISLEEAELDKEFDKYRLLVGNRAEQLIELATQFRKEVKVGMAGITSDPESLENPALQFQFKRKLIHAIVTRVDVLEDKSIEVHTEFDFAGNFSTSLTGWQSK